MNDRAAIEAFLEMMSAERGAAVNTLEAYRRDLEDAAGFLAETGLVAAAAEDLRRYLSDLARRDFAASSAARRLSALRRFYRFLLEEKTIAADPCVALDGPKRVRPLPKILTEGEVERLLARAEEEALVAEAPERLRALRLWALLELAYATGLRVSELVGLPAAAGRPKGRTIVVRGKGGRERLVPLIGAAETALYRYMSVRQVDTKLSRSPWLFPAEGESGHLARQVFGRELKALAQRAGIAAAKVAPHVLRHAFASHLLAHGADLRTVQQLLGHADIATTQIYTHVLDESFRNLVERHHPLADQGGDDADAPAEDSSGAGG